MKEKSKAFVRAALGVSCMFLSMHAADAQRIIRASGKVVDAKDLTPLAGATIARLGGKEVAVANSAGIFEIRVPEGSILRVSELSYDNAQVKADTSMLVKLLLSSSNLDAVVVLGYGVQKKSAVSGSIGVVKMDDVKRMVPTTSAGNLLQGQVAGLKVNTPAGVPGAKPSFNIRQETTFDKDPDHRGPSQPVLFVIDGMVANADDFNNLSPNDIDNVSVLRDAAAAAAYGARAAGGVIVVTTRRGVKGKPVINYSFNTGFDKRTKNAPLTSAVETGLLYNRINPDATDLWSQQELDFFKTVNNGWGYDQLATIWRNPSTTSHNLNVSGGSDKVRYYMGGSMISQKSFVENLDYKKYNLRSNVTADITDRLQLFAGLALNTTNRYSPPTKDDFNDWYGKLRIWQPEQPVWTNGGHPVDYGWIMNMGAQVRGDGGYKKNTLVNPTINLKLSYKIPGIDGLTASAQYNRNWSNTRYKYFEKKYDVWVMKRTGNRILSLDEKDLVGLKKTYQVSNEYLEEDYRWTDYSQLNLQLSYDRTFHKRHHVGGWVLMEQAQTEVGGADAYRQNFPVYTTDQWWAASKEPNDKDVDGITNEKNGRKSWVGQFFYDYDGKYLATFSYRYDGSYKFPVDSRWGFFPSASVGWVISKENFFRNINGVQFLKLRASAGLTSSDNIDAYQWMQVYKTGENAYFGTSPVTNTGIQYGNITNPVVTWEKTKSYNVAVDVDFLHHFNATAEYYFINTYDILAKRIQTISPTFPREMPAENYGEVHANGVELTVGYNNRIGNVRYYVNANASYGGAKYIVKDQNATYPYQNEIGHSTTRIVTRVADHILRTQSDLDAWNAAHPNYKYYGIAPQLGQMVYQDINGPDGKPDGIIDDWDKVELKQNNNPILLGINLGFEWKGISVDATINGNLKQYKYVNDLANNVEWNRNWKEWYTNSWTPDNPGAYLPRRYSANDGNKRVTTDESSFWLTRSDFLRLRLLNIGYSLPSKLINRWGVGAFKVYFSGSNLFVISKFNSEYYDPEMGSHANYPVMKTFNFGVNVTL
ncbi:SusC/RagA family TonB-linked outer membrane protein [Chitinophaga varians]|uniref:SusC/RagA family TonB-linked outer membrane protein n=1 Tax=Chitinophaga varians TaxID=2202339 RepID=UPI00165FD89F|nr:SusC/RagA family TonB-linked outer membrane protein [Chitinophaga varians]MBC9909415.1 SusC/RagA family TonB-linked outer membrane protein [Chitinophaga varians]